MDNDRPRLHTVVEEQSDPTVTPVPTPIVAAVEEPKVTPVEPVIASPQPVPTPVSIPQANSGPSTSGFGHMIRRLMFIVPALLLLGTIVIVGYITKNAIGSKITPTPIPTEVPELIPGTPVPTPKPILKPKTYLNLVNQFSLKYPSELTLTECSNSLHFTLESAESKGLCDGTTSGIIKLSWNTELVLPEFGDGFSVTEEYIKVGGLDGTRQIVTKKEGTEGLAYQVYITFSRDKLHFSLSLNNKDYEEQFNSILQSFKVINEDLTANWKTYTNTSFRYSLKYPEEWTATVSATQKDKQVVEIAKTPDTNKLHTLVIEATTNVTNAQLSASDITSSTRNLLGWKTPPSVDLRSIGTGAAQIIQGQFDANWQVFVVIWYKNRIVQMSWLDSLDRGEQETVDSMLSTFKFLP